MSTNIIPVEVSIGIQVLQQFAVGGTVEERFANIIKPQHIRDACWMTTDQDKQFRAAVGALMLSYGPGTPEFERIEVEMRQVQALSALIAAAAAGVGVSSLPEMPEDFVPIGLLGLWRARER